MHEISVGLKKFWSDVRKQRHAEGGSDYVKAAAERARSQMTQGEKVKRMQEARRKRRERDAKGLPPPGPSVMTGAEFAALRGRLGFNQRELAHEFGVCLATIMKLERSPYVKRYWQLALRFMEVRMSARGVALAVAAERNVL